MEYLDFKSIMENQKYQFVASLTWEHLNRFCPKSPKTCQRQMVEIMSKEGIHE